MASFTITESVIRQIVRDEIRLRRSRSALTTEIAARGIGLLNESAEIPGEIAYLDGNKLTAGQYAVPAALSKMQWFIRARNPSDDILLLEKLGAGDNTTPLSNLYTSIPIMHNSSGQNQAEYVRLNFPFETSKFHFGSGKFDRSQMYVGLIRRIREVGPKKYAIVHGTRASATGRTSTGEATSIIQRYAEEPAGRVLDATVDMTKLAIETGGIVFPAFAVPSQAAAKTITYAQILSKVARFDALGVFLDIISLVPFVGSAFSTAAKRFQDFIDTIPSAVPLRVIDEVAEASAKIIAGFFKSSAKSFAKMVKESPAVMKEIMSADSVSDFLTATKNLFLKYGIVGVAAFVLYKAKADMLFVDLIYKAIVSFNEKLNRARGLAESQQLANSPASTRS